MIFQQLLDFRDESEALYRLIEGLREEDFSRETQFKGWTIHDVLAHLHLFNWAAEASVKDDGSFTTFYEAFVEQRKSGLSMQEVTDSWLDQNADGVRNRALLKTWRSYYLGMAERLGTVDPKKRVQWAGPDMSVRSSLTARLMETWAHAQEVYDLLGVVRNDTDRIQNICVLGLNTFGWTFRNRGLEIPDDVPYLELKAPSGQVWSWNEPSSSNFVRGSATEFCQVVAQTRNIADTQLSVEGETASRWMAIAQCFAGAPEDPPAPGLRGPKSG